MKKHTNQQRVQIIDYSKRSKSSPDVNNLGKNMFATTTTHETTTCDELDGSGGCDSRHGKVVRRRKRSKSPKK